MRAKRFSRAGWRKLPGMLRSWKSCSETSMPPERPPLLALAGITAGYRRLQVLWGVDLCVNENESVVLLGANGAGKTTLLKTIMSLVEPWDGRIDFAGEDITRLRTDQRVRRGIVFMSETSGFPGLSMAELFGLFPALAERRRALAGSLSGGQRKMLGVAKALAGNPRLVVMDEPSAGLSPRYVKEVIGVLAQFRSQTLALLIAEQNVKFLALADRVYTLEAAASDFP